MKKLLGILGLISLSVSPSVTVISCGSNSEDKHLNDKGNSIWAWLPSLADGGSPDSADVWGEINPFGGDQDSITNPANWDGPTRKDAMIKIMKIFSVSILAHSSDENIWNSKLKNAFADYGGYSNLQAQLENDWTNLKNSVDNEISNKKSSYKTQYGKKWNKKWKDMLKDKYDSSEDNYKAYLMAESSVSNATTLLQNTLLKGQRSYITADSATIKNLFETNIFKKTKEEIYNYVTSNPETGRELALGTAVDTKGGEEWYTDLWSADEEGSIKISDIVSSLFQESQKTNLGDVTFRDAPVWSDCKKTGDGANEKITGNRKLSNSGTMPGILSPTQSFVATHWYNNERPLAVSSVSFKFDADSEKLKNAVTVNSFKNSKQQISEVLNAPSWTSLIGSGTATIQQKLLTFDSKDFNTAEKAAVYSNLSDLTTIPQSGTASTLDDLLPKINRDKGSDTTSHMSKVITIGSGEGNISNVVAYIDDDGLNFVKIQGVAAGGEALHDSSKQFITNEDQSADIDNFNNIISKKSKKELQDITDADLVGDSGADYFNKSISNTYLQYLINKSYINTKIGSQSFDPVKEINSYAVLDSSTKGDNGLWFTWIFDLFKNAYTGLLNTPTDTDWYKNYITIGDGSSTANAAEQNWFTSETNNTSAMLYNSPIVNFISEINKENDTIQGFGKDAPPDQFNVSTPSDVANNEWWKYIKEE